MNELIMKTSKMGEYVQNEIKTEYIKVKIYNINKDKD